MQVQTYAETMYLDKKNCLNVLTHFSEAKFLDEQRNVSSFQPVHLKENRGEFNVQYINARWIKLECNFWDSIIWVGLRWWIVCHMEPGIQKSLVIKHNYDKQYIEFRWKFQKTKYLKNGNNTYFVARFIDTI